MNRCAVLFVVPVLLVTISLDVHAQAGPIRLKVSKTEKKDRRTVSKSTDGTYRRQQITSTVTYTIEAANFGTAALPRLKVKWAVLVDSSRAEAQANGITTWTNDDLKVLEGERQTSLGLGQKFVFDTDPVDSNNVNTEYTWEGRRYKYGGGVRGYLVEVYDGDRLIASEYNPQDVKRQIEQARAKAEKKK